MTKKDMNPEDGATESLFTDGEEQDSEEMEAVDEDENETAADSRDEPETAEETSALQLMGQFLGEDETDEKDEGEPRVSRLRHFGGDRPSAPECLRRAEACAAQNPLRYGEGAPSLR